MKKRFVLILLLSLFFALFSFILSQQGITSKWIISSTDMFHSDENIFPFSEIVIVGIEEKDLEEAQFGRWPWDRSLWANVIDNISEQHPSLIAIDVLFSEQNKSEQNGDQEFVDAVRSAKNVILAEKREQNGENISPWEELKAAAFATVPINTYLSSDGVVRAISPLFEGNIPGFSVQIVQKYLGEQSVARKEAQSLILTDKKIRNPIFPQKKYQPITIPLENDLMNIRFFSKPFSVPHVSFSDVYNNNIDPDFFTGKIVLIGALAPTLHDEFLVPTSNGTLMPGIEVHAQAIATILSQRFLLSPDESSKFLFTLLLSILNGILFYRFAIWSAVTTLISELLFLFVLSIGLFEIGIIFDFVTPLIALLLVFTGTMLLKLFWTRKERSFLSGAIGRYVSKNLAQTLLKDPQKLQLGGEDKELTVLFSDIVNFTPLSEGLKADELVEILNEYFDEMSQVVFAYDGTLDKFIGDAIMAFWGAPVSDEKHAEKAVLAAIDMQKRAALLRKKWKQESNGWPPIHLRIGISTGNVVVGNIGSKERFDYTIIGDSVNVGARIESINKQYRTNILLSQYTAEHLPDSIPLREIDSMAVKGKTEPITVFEPQLTSEKTFTDYTEALALYRKGNFAEAKESFKKALIANAEDGPSQIMFERCEEFLHTPPKNWNGIWVWETK